MIQITQLPKRQPGQFDWILALVVTTAAVLLHLIFLYNAGGLWRDEAGVVRLATLPALGETWKYLGHESCPVFFPAAIHSWSAIGFGGTDFGLRIYGMIVGLLLLGAIWLNGMALTRSVPLISLGLLATNLTVVRWGDSLRAYGTGSVLMLLAVAFMWQFVARPSRGRWLLALLAALASVQCLFQNSFLLLAVCIAGGAVCLRRKDVKNVAAVFAVGLLAALSLIPYLHMIHEAKNWSVLSQSGFMPAMVWQNLSNALAYATPWMKWLWIGLGLLTIFRWAKILAHPPDPNDRLEAPATFFAATALVCGVVLFFVYLRLAALPTQIWYYLPLMTFAAVCLDAAMAEGILSGPVWRWLFICVVVAMPFGKTLQVVQYRQTNMDFIAPALCEQAGPDDLIILHPWYYGISFDRYYKGKTPWTTIPDLADHRFHRYDLLKIKMVTATPVQPVLDKITATLQSGHRVWIVGGLIFPNTPPPDLGPAPNPYTGWLDEPYSRIWGASAGYLLATHTEKSELISIPCSNNVSAFENLPVQMFTGWHELTPVKTAN